MCYTEPVQGLQTTSWMQPKVGIIQPHDEPRIRQESLLWVHKIISTLWNIVNYYVSASCPQYGISYWKNNFNALKHLLSTKGSRLNHLPEQGRGALNIELSWAATCLCTNTNTRRHTDAQTSAAIIVCVTIHHGGGQHGPKRHDKSLLGLIKLHQRARINPAHRLFCILIENDKKHSWLKCSKSVQTENQPSVREMTTACDRFVTHCSPASSWAQSDSLTVHWAEMWHLPGLIPCIWSTQDLKK